MSYIDVIFFGVLGQQSGPSRSLIPVETDDTMKLTPWYFAAIAPVAVAGCSGTLLGHFAVLAVTLGIFVGTLSLGRHTTPSAPVAALEDKS